MSLTRSLWLVVLSAALVVGWTGCNSATPQKTPKAPAPEGKPAAATSSAHEHGGSAAAKIAVPQEHGHSPVAKIGSEGLAELSAEDRALAEKQRICPVSGEPLGSMGKPVKVTVKGRTVFLCCDGCEAEIKKDPDKYLAKLETAGSK